MKRFLGIVAVLSVFLASLLCSSLFFFPWGEVGEYGIGLVSQSLARQGLPLAYDRIEADGRFLPDFVLTNVAVGNMLGSLHVKEIVLHPRFVASLLNFGATAELSFQDAEIAFGKQGRAALSSGSLVALLGRKSARIDVTETRGDIRIRGHVVVDPPTRRIAGANMEFGVSDVLDAKLSALKGILPFEREKKGLWRWKQGEAK